MICHTVCLANQKGGVAKTTSTVNLGVYLSRQGHSVLIVDSDPQTNATSSLGVRRGDIRENLYDVLTGAMAADQACQATATAGLDLLAASPHLAALELEFGAHPGREHMLAHALSSLHTRYRYILIDSPPSLGLLTLNGMVAANFLVVPVQCEYLALEGMTAIMNSLERVQQTLNPQLTLAGFLLTLYDSRTRLSRDVESEVRHHFPAETFTHVIPRSVRLAEAPSHGVPVAVYDPSSAGAIAYERWALELVHRLDHLTAPAD